MINLEFKARLHDRPALLAVLQTLPATFAGVFRQCDTYFQVASGRLKLREITPLTPAEAAPAECQLIYYQRPDVAAVKRSDYALAPVHDAGRMKQVLRQALGVRVVVVKRRELYLLAMPGGGIRIHLDQVEGLGEFVEVEAVAGDASHAARAEAEAHRLLHVFGVRRADLISGSYADMLMESPCS
ncbi:MAG: class IV adenylate cyclase [candidate division KSB1 bacterium]|nr:class IV adenylate cyclase [candidate division KSB1 bacterium]MDZ7275963.1 class IV adenylate cyclase [candidate division KSB1 bacterium]MDZ7285755.1 class IV adenylate cyclase [candidate division KSB1 bacterium]MDZ7298787.1 class IV adenylate cyclase [candidate division KSB1 bacterium]MDZ7307923.1 class IV adenylate cyclase [candidate division KSB1 bacterium]